MLQSAVFLILCVLVFLNLDAFGQPNHFGGAGMGPGPGDGGRDSIGGGGMGPHGGPPMRGMGDGGDHGRGFEGRDDDDRNRHGWRKGGDRGDRGGRDRDNNRNDGSDRNDFDQGASDNNGGGFDWSSILGG